jgi:hypothetical protein
MMDLVIIKIELAEEQVIIKILAMDFIVLIKSFDFNSPKPNFKRSLYLYLLMLI